MQTYRRLRQVNRQTDRETDKQADTKTGRQRDRQTDKETDRQTEWQTDGMTRQTDINRNTNGRAEYVPTDSKKADCTENTSGYSQS